jgi:hypothetical protein
VEKDRSEKSEKDDSENVDVNGNLDLVTGVCVLV